MSWDESLLIPEASPWERAVEGTSSARWPLQWDLLRTLQNADAIPEDKLAILAWALSVDIWDPTWPAEKKRSVVRQSIRDHSLKGTIAGVRRYLDIEDAELVMYMAPPQDFYASRNLTKEEMDAWLESMPQLRIYLRSRPGDGTGLLFADEGFADYDFATFDEGESIYGRFPVLYDRGVSTPLRTSTVTITTEEREAVQVDRINSRGVGGFSFADEDFVGSLYADDTVKKAEVYTVETVRTYQHTESALSLTTLTPSLNPINVRFTRESEIGFGGPYLFADNDFASPSFFIGRDDAEWMLFDRIYLHDTTRATPLVDALSFANHARISMSPFTAEFMVDGNGHTDTIRKFEGEFVGNFFAIDEDLSKIDRQMDAVALSKGYRDKALVTFETTRPREWGDGYPLDGSVPLWSRVDAAL